jgi:hypothetical protein
MMVQQLHEQPVHIFNRKTASPYACCVRIPSVLLAQFQQGSRLPASASSTHLCCAAPFVSSMFAHMLAGQCKEVV